MYASPIIFLLWFLAPDPTVQRWAAVRLHQLPIARSQWALASAQVIRAKSTKERAQPTIITKPRITESERSRIPCRSRSGNPEPKSGAVSINCREPRRQLNTLPLCSAETTVSRKEESRKRVPLKFTEIKADKSSSSPATDKVPKSRLNDLRSNHKNKQKFRTVQWRIRTPTATTSPSLHPHPGNGKSGNRKMWPNFVAVISLLCLAFFAWAKAGPVPIVNEVSG